AAPAAPVALEELRFRSYPAFTRLVLETSSPLTARVEASGGKEARIRLFGLTADARTEEIGDGFIEEARLERAGADAILKVVFEGSAGEVKTSALADPPRLVLDFLRPPETVPSRERRDAVTPLRLIVLGDGHRGAPGGCAREQRGAAREDAGPRRSRRRRQGDPVGPRAVGVPAGVLAAGRGRAGLDDAGPAHPQPRREAGRLLRPRRRRHAGRAD